MSRCHVYSWFHWQRDCPSLARTVLFLTQVVKAWRCCGCASHLFVCLVPMESQYSIKQYLVKYSASLLLWMPVRVPNWTSFPKALLLSPLLTLAFPSELSDEIPRAVVGLLPLLPASLASLERPSRNSARRKPEWVIQADHIARHFVERRFRGLHGILLPPPIVLVSLIHLPLCFDVARGRAGLEGEQPNLGCSPISRLLVGID